MANNDNASRYVKCKDSKGRFYAYAPFFFRKFREVQQMPDDKTATAAEVGRAFRKSLCEEPVKMHTGLST